MSTNKYIGIGSSCQTAWQIRRFTGDEETYLFDWVLTPYSSFERLFGNFDENEFLKLEKIDKRLLVGEDTTLRCPYSKIGFAHEFKEFKNEKIDLSRVGEDLERVKSKFKYLRDKTIRAIESSDRIFFIRSESYWSELNRFRFVFAEGIERQFGSVLAGKEPVFVIASPALNKTEVKDNAVYYKLDPSDLTEDDPEFWKGNDESYDKLFALLESM